MAVKLTFHGEKNCGEKKLAVQKEKKKGSNSFSSAPNTCETYGAHSHAAVARLGHVIVNSHLLLLSHAGNRLEHILCMLQRYVSAKKKQMLLKF